MNEDCFDISCSINDCCRGVLFVVKGRRTGELQQKKWPNVSVIIVNWNGEVLVTYHSLSPVEQKAREWVLAGCGTFSGTNASTFELYNVDDMKLVSGRPDNSGR